MHGIIYILTNEAMPGYVKVGFTTTSIEQRLRELDTTSVPLPFGCYYAAQVESIQEVEKLIHDVFLDRRVRRNREFFQVSPDRIVSAIKLREIKNVTPWVDIVSSEEDKKVLNEARKKRSIFNFKMVGIPTGATLTFVNDEHITATVIDNRSIHFQGVPTSLSLAAQKILGYSYGVAWTIYWMYEGETLDERRTRMETEE